MGVRLTGISTPVGGVSWEYTKAEERSAPLPISPGQKIKVFISSICGVEKYDKVRAELKKAIERTQLVDVYTFESRGASTLPAGDHYILALEDSDICIFLIDNVMLPARVEAAILQNVLQWLHSEYTDIRWNATRILLTMSRNPENSGIVNHQLVNLIDSDSVYIKNLIIRHLHKMNGITDGTKEYIISKCKQDANFVVRMVCDEVEKGVAEE